MRARSGRTAMVAGILMGTIGLGTTAGAQESTAAKPDSAPHFALFGGRPAISGNSREGGFAFGASGDFRWKPIPVPLRLSLSFDERHDDFAGVTRRGGQASLDLVFRPIAKTFGIQPYFLGGAGLATRAPFNIYGDSYTLYQPDGTPVFYMSVYPQRRQTWAFASAGMGLDIGRAFIEFKLENPIASQGELVTPLTVGFRFWD